MQHAHHLQLQWLQNCLAHQLHTSKMMEKADSFLAQEEADTEQGQRDHNEKTRKKNEARRLQEEQQMAERLAQQKLEQQIAKEEFEKQLHELEKQKKLGEQKRKEMHSKSVADQEAKAEAERQKVEKRRQAWLMQQRKLEEMRANDDKRKAIRYQQKANFQQEMRDKKQFKEDRIALSMSNLNKRTDEKYEQFRAKQNLEHAREERLRNLSILKQEEGVRNGLQMQMKRKSIADEANRKLEERRQNIVDHQAQVEHRLMLHEMKKERYLEFKAELESLRERNKAINVVKQRRRDDQKREDYAAQARRKNDKCEMLRHERQFLWGLRRSTGQAISKANEEIKALMTKMKLKSSYDSRVVESEMRRIFKRKAFLTDFSTVQSLPDLNLGGSYSATDAASGDTVAAVHQESSAIVQVQ